MKILVIPDLHLPYEHIDALKFVSSISKELNPDRVVFLGDELDYHSISFHDKDPDSPFSPSKELEESISKLQEWYKEFPEADLLDSNHGSLVYRKGKYHGLPRRVFREYKDLLETPKWCWTESLLIENIHFCHQFAGNPALLGKDIVAGHHHTKFEIIYRASEYRFFFTAFAGCLIDAKSFAYAYQKTNIAKPSLGCMAIMDGTPMLLPMILNSKDRWVGK